VLAEAQELEEAVAILTTPVMTLEEVSVEMVEY